MWAAPGMGAHCIAFSTRFIDQWQLSVLPCLSLWWETLLQCKSNPSWESSNDGSFSPSSSNSQSDCVLKCAHYARTLKHREVSSFVPALGAIRLHDSYNSYKFGCRGNQNSRLGGRNDDLAGDRTFASTTSPQAYVLYGRVKCR